MHLSAYHVFKHKNVQYKIALLRNLANVKFALKHWYLILMLSLSNVQLTKYINQD